MLVVRALFALFLALAVTTQASAEEGRRFATSHITPVEWQTFFDEVRAKPGARDVSRADVPSVAAIEVPSEATIYFFTKPGWGAHPAVVVERIVKRSGRTYVQHDGYFAGAELAFVQWFNAFKQRSDEIRKAMKAKP
jgi:hypothetical protein